MRSFSAFVSLVDVWRDDASEDKSMLEKEGCLFDVVVEGGGCFEEEEQ